MARPMVPHRGGSPCRGGRSGRVLKSTGEQLKGIAKNLLVDVDRAAAGGKKKTAGGKRRLTERTTSAKKVTVTLVKKGRRRELRG